MPDDLVVREWAETHPQGKLWGRIARAYLAVVAERDRLLAAQKRWIESFNQTSELRGDALRKLAAMTSALAEAVRLYDETLSLYHDSQAQLAAMTEERDNWRKAHRETFDRLTRLCADLQQEINDE